MHSATHHDKCRLAAEADATEYREGVGSTDAADDAAAAAADRDDDDKADSDDATAYATALAAALAARAAAAAAAAGPSEGAGQRVDHSPPPGWIVADAPMSTLAGTTAPEVFQQLLADMGDVWDWSELAVPLRAAMDHIGPPTKGETKYRELLSAVVGAFRGFGLRAAHQRNVRVIRAHQGILHDRIELPTTNVGADNGITLLLASRRPDVVEIEGIWERWPSVERPADAARDVVYVHALTTTRPTELSPRSVLDPDAPRPGPVVTIRIPAGSPVHGIRLGGAADGSCVYLVNVPGLAAWHEPDTPHNSWQRHPGGFVPAGAVARVSQSEAYAMITHLKASAGSRHILDPLPDQLQQSLVDNAHVELCGNPADPGWEPTVYNGRRYGPAAPLPMWRSEDASLHRSAGCKAMGLPPAAVAPAPHRKLVAALIEAVVAAVKIASSFSSLAAAQKAVEAAFDRFEHTGVLHLEGVLMGRQCSGPELEEQVEMLLGHRLTVFFEHYSPWIEVEAVAPAAPGPPQTAAPAPGTRGLYVPWRALRTRVRNVVIADRLPRILDALAANPVATLLELGRAAAPGGVNPSVTVGDPSSGLGRQLGHLTSYGATQYNDNGGHPLPPEYSFTFAHVPNVTRHRQRATADGDLGSDPQRVTLFEYQSDVHRHLTPATARPALAAPAPAPAPAPTPAAAPAAAPTPAATPSERRPAKTRRVERSPDIPVPMADPDTRQSMMPKAVGRAPRPTALFVVRDTTNAIIVTLAKPLATHLVMMVADVKKSQRCSACGANGRERKRSYAFPNHPQRGVWGCPVCALGTTSHALWKALVPLIAGTTNSVVIRDPQSAL